MEQLSIVHQLTDPLMEEHSEISIIIPVLNGGESFRQCLASITRFSLPATEVIVVIDGGTDGSEKIAQEFEVKILKLPVTGGPAKARNCGANIANGKVLFFMDADVVLGAETLPRILATFKQPSPDALIGSYDDAPGASNFLSQYKNLFHHYTHQTASAEAFTFWGACGAVRRQVFWSVGGFNESYRYPSIEDIELGYRLRQAGYSIRLDRAIQVKHLKRWNIISLCRAEVLYRAIPWTMLIWRDRQLNNDLNLGWTTRLSLVLTYVLILSLIAAPGYGVALGVTAIAGFSLISLNYPIYRFFWQKRGPLFMLQVIPWHWFYFFYSGLSFAIGTIAYFLTNHSPLKPWKRPTENI